MTLNCRQGDVALIKRCDHPENRDAVVWVLRRVVLTAQPDEPAWLIRSEGRKLIATDAETLLLAYSAEAKCPDAWLRPIRGGEGEDEILRLTGLPRDHVQELAHALRG